MALTICPECKKEVSDKASSCPNCGFPFNTDIAPNEFELLKYPELPSDLNIGSQLDSILTGHYHQEENLVKEIPTGKVRVIQHTHGIVITSGFYVERLKIHSSQIISLKATSKVELLRVDKSVIGRAIVGGLILGPLGAVVGGMSGIGTKQQTKDKSFLIINYWDMNSKSPQTLLVSGDKNGIKSFIERNEKENSTNQTQNRKAKVGGGCMGIIIIFIISFLTIMSCGRETRESNLKTSFTKHSTVNEMLDSAQDYQGNCVEICFD